MPSTSSPPRSPRRGGRSRCRTAPWAVPPALPVRARAGIAGVATALARLRIEPRKRVRIEAATLSVLALLLLRGSDNPFLPEDRADQTERKILGLWLNEHTPDDYTIAAWAVGSIAYHSERDVLDLFGLTDEVIAHTDVENFGEGLPGHERHNADYVLDEIRPEIIVTGDAVGDPLDSEAFWRVYGKPGGLPAKDAIMAGPRLPDLYDVRSVQIEGHWFNFLQRKDTLADFQASGLR